MAFVPQDDIMYDDLTVEENVLYSAVLFNRRNFTLQSECLLLVNYILNMLGIDFIKNSRVGSPEERGISGGQKVCIELLMLSSNYLLLLTHLCRNVCLWLSS
jgi:ABC-type multidrug transport system ATPase subunit